MSYKIGVGKSDITDRRKDLQMQGMSDPSQKTTGIDSSSPLYSRAFVIQDPSNGKAAAIVVADIWSGTALLKEKVLEKLKANHLSDYLEDNLLLAGTHTHSAPAGYTGYTLFDQPSGSVEKHTLDIIANGIVESIKAAHNSKADGKIYVNRGTIHKVCGKQRSAPAYENNPEAERDEYAGDTDKEMLLMKFVKSGNPHTPVGVLNWYAIHPTDLGQANTLISGDNKGYASFEFEQEMSRRKIPDFVAAFANSNCGDVSGNVGLEIVNAKGEPIDTDDVKRMKENGDIQYETALDLFDTAEDEVTGGIEYWHTRIDMSNIRIKGTTSERTWRYALGMSFAAGSTEDSIPRYKDPLSAEIKTVENVKEGITNPVPAEYSGTQLMLSAGLFANFWDAAGIASPDEVSGHGKKPIVLIPNKQEGLVPHHLPIQLFSIGNFAIAGVPGELTTMAGRRLRKTIDNTLTNLHRKVNHVALCTYANDYAQYITTAEEYDMQHYEGASTPFGPNTLKAYQQEFENLVARSVGQADKHIIYQSDSFYDVWFFISYEDANGETQELAKDGYQVKQYTNYNYAVPWDAKNIQVCAEYTKGLGKKQGESTHSVNVSLESGQAKLVLFTNEALQYDGTVMPKTIICNSGSLYDTVFDLWYTDTNGHVTKIRTNVVKSYTFHIPWDASNIRVRAQYIKAGGKWSDPNSSNLLRPTPGSGQVAHLDFRDPNLSLNSTDWN
jgi:neutral ceramidase